MTKNKKIFITGGLGYIGSAFAKEALKQNYDILLYDSLIYEQAYEEILDEITSTKKDSSSVKLVIGDVRNTDLLRYTMKNFDPDFCIHLAELSSVYACDHNPPFTEDINYRASKRVIDICAELDIPVLYNSTSSLYGNQKDSQLMKETDPLPAHTDNYCKYKLWMENYIKEKKSKEDFNIIVFRPATVCGVSPRMRIELLPNHFTYCAIAKGVIKISEMHAYRAAMDIQDMIKAYFKVIEKGTWDKLIYNLGSYNFSKLQFSETIQDTTGCEIVEIPNIGDLRNLQIDCSLFENEFEFKPSITYKQTVDDLVSWIGDKKTEMEESDFAGILNMSLEQWSKII